jgi:hypothetical protein
VFSWGAVEGTGRKKKYRKKVETNKTTKKILGKLSKR